MKKAEFKPNQPKPNRRGGASFFYYNGYHVMLGLSFLGGGDRFQQEFNDIWHYSYDSSSNENLWKNIEHKGAISYTPRTGQAATLCGNQIFVYGGQKFGENKMYGDAFLYDIGMQQGLINELEKNTWETLTNTNKPSDRNSCSVVYDKKRNRVILFGGANENGPLDDIYSYNIDSKSWEKLPTTGPLKPLAREMHTAVVYHGILDFPTVEYTKVQETKQKEKTIDLNFISGITDKNEETKEEGNDEESKVSEVEKQVENISLDKGTSKESSYMIIIGGKHINEQSQEVLALDLETLEWKFLVNSPIKVCTHACDLAYDKIFIFGGTDGLQFLDGLFCLDLKTRTWSIFFDKRKKKLSFLPTIAASLSYNEKNNDLVFFGGCTYETDLNEIYYLSLDEKTLSDCFQKL